MRDINELNVIGSGTDRRVETKDESADNQEIVVRYPRPSAGLTAEEKARFASLASKGLAHLGYSDSRLTTFVSGLFDSAEADAFEVEDECSPESVVIDGVLFVRA